METREARIVVRLDTDEAKAKAVAAAAGPTGAAAASGAPGAPTPAQGAAGAAQPAPAAPAGPGTTGGPARPPEDEERDAVGVRAARAAAATARRARSLYDAATSDGLYGRVAGFVASLPGLGAVAGPALRGAELGEHVGPAVAASLPEELGGGASGPLARQVGELATRFADLKARVDAIGQTGGSLEGLALLQIRATGSVAPEELRAVAPLLYRANVDLGVPGRAVRTMTAKAVGQALGEVAGEAASGLRDLLRASLPGGMGR